MASKARRSKDFLAFRRRVDRELECRGLVSVMNDTKWRRLVAFFDDFSVSAAVKTVLCDEPGVGHQEFLGRGADFGVEWVRFGSRQEIPRGRLIDSYWID